MSANDKHKRLSDRSQQDGSRNEILHTAPQLDFRAILATRRGAVNMRRVRSAFSDPRMQMACHLLERDSGSFLPTA